MSAGPCGALRTVGFVELLQKLSMRMWTVALDACERAFAAIACARALPSDEVRRRRLSLQAERRWLTTVDAGRR